MFSHHPKLKKIATTLLFTGSCFGASYYFWLHSNLPGTPTIATYPEGLVGPYIGKNGSVSFGFSFGDKTKIMNTSLSPEGIHKIVVNAESIPVKIDFSNSGKIEILWEGDIELYKSSDLAIQNQDGVLSLTILKNLKTSFFLSHFTGLTISLPPSLMFIGTPPDTTKTFTMNLKNTGKTDLEAHSTTGSVIVDSVGLANVDIHTITGSVTVKGVMIHKLSISTVDGKIESQGGAENFSLETVSGNISATLYDFDDQARFKTVSGNVDVKAQKEFNATLDFSSHTGNSEIDRVSDIRTNVTEKTKHVFGKGTGAIHVETVSGNLAVTTQK